MGLREKTVGGGHGGGRWEECQEGKWPVRLSGSGGGGGQRAERALTYIEVKSSRDSCESVSVSTTGGRQAAVSSTTLSH